MIGADRYRPEETPKQRRIIALAAAALVAAALPSSAQAGCRGCAVGAGAIGGLAAGALIGSAIANSQPRSTPPCPPAMLSCRNMSTGRFATSKNARSGSKATAIAGAAWKLAT